MRKDIHPEINEITARCVCGNSFKTTSTAKEISVDICAACHPFFTGTQRFVDTAGRIDKFQKRYKSKKASSKATAENKKSDKEKK